MMSETQEQHVSGGWRTMDDTPRDGTEVMLYGEGDRRTGPVPGRWIDALEVRLREAGWYWAGYDGLVGPIRPTHWMPLPDPPEAP